MEIKLLDTSLDHFHNAVDDWKVALAIKQDYYKATKRLVQSLIALDKTKSAKEICDWAVAASHDNKSFLPSWWNKEIKRAWENTRSNW